MPTSVTQTRIQPDIYPLAFLFHRFSGVTDTAQFSSARLAVYTCELTPLLRPLHHVRRQLVHGHARLTCQLMQHLDPPGRWRTLLSAQQVGTLTRNLDEDTTPTRGAKQYCKN